MPISLNSLKNDKRAISGEYFGDTFNVTYRPSGLTPAVESELQESANNDVLMGILCELIEKWDILDEAGDPLPIEIDVMRQLPSALLGHIIQACREDMAPKAKPARR